MTARRRPEPPPYDTLVQAFRNRQVDLHKLLIYLQLVTVPQQDELMTIYCRSNHDLIEVPFLTYIRFQVIADPILERIRRMNPTFPPCPHPVTSLQCETWDAFFNTLLYHPAHVTSFTMERTGPQGPTPALTVMNMSEPVSDALLIPFCTHYRTCIELVRELYWPGIQLYLSQFCQYTGPHLQNMGHRLFYKSFRPYQLIPILKSEYDGSLISDALEEEINFVHTLLDETQEGLTDDQQTFFNLVLVRSNLSAPDSPVYS